MENNAVLVFKKTVLGGIPCYKRTVLKGGLPVLITIFQIPVLNFNLVIRLPIERKHYSEFQVKFVKTNSVRGMHAPYTHRQSPAKYHA